MKIALVAVPRPQHTVTRIAPPLPLGYLAALLEQRRYIVRVYDLALVGGGAYTAMLAPLQVFRPHLVVLAAEDGADLGEVEAALARVGVPVVRLRTSLHEDTPSQAAACSPFQLGEHGAATDKQSMIADTLCALDDELDTLPFPARHLLPLETYPLYTPSGDLQTSILAAQQLLDGRIALRQVTQVLAEIESVIREYGIRHFVFHEPFMMCNGEWLHALLQELIAAKLDICWEASVSFEQFDTDVLWLFQRAGCETLCVAFSAGDVLESRELRAALSQFVAQAHALGLSVRGQITLAPPFGALAALVDLAATFGLDAVAYTLLPQAATSRQSSASDEKLLIDVMKFERSRRSRELFVERFGPQLGPMLWHVGRFGLLGPTWRRYAYGDDGAYVY